MLQIWISTDSLCPPLRTYGRPRFQWENCIRCKGSTLTRYSHSFRQYNSEYGTAHGGGRIILLRCGFRHTQPTVKWIPSLYRRTGMYRSIPIAATALMAGFAALAYAAATGPSQTVEIPGNALDNFDIGTIDAQAGRYYLADRSNSAVDVFDTRNRRFLAHVTG